MLYSVNKNDNNADNFTDPHNAYTFSGTQWDEQTALNYYGSRNYDSWNGTWSTQDSYRGMIEEPMSLHRTAFVQNNPINYYDPDGFLLKELWGKVQDAGEVIVNKALQQTSEALTFDVGVNIPFVNIDIHVNNQLNATYTNGTLVAQEDFNGTVLTPNHNVNVNAQADLVYGNGAYASGTSFTLTADGKKIYQNTNSSGNKLGYSHLGVSSSQEHINQMNQQAKDQINLNLLKTKSERDQRLKVIEENNRKMDKQNSYLDALNYIKDQGFFYNLGDGRLMQAILFEQAIAKGINIDDPLFRQYLAKRESALKTPGITALIDFWGRDEVVEYYALLNSIYNDPDKSDLTEADYYSLAKEMLALQEKTLLRNAEPVIGMTGGIASGGSKMAGTVSLGKNPGYKLFGDAIGAKYLNISDDVWNAMSDAERWAVNQKFLDDAIARGDEFILSHSTKFATEGSFFRKELDYLFERGYELAEDGLSLINTK